MEPVRQSRPICVALVLFGLAASAVAQTPPTAEQYQDALNQLKAAQDRKNELATENQKLRQQVADQQKQAAEHAARLATWQQFLDQNPSVRSMWTAFFTNTADNDRARELLGDGQWPFAIEG